MACGVAVSETFSQRNTRMSTADAFAICQRLAQRARADGVWLRAYLMTAWVCPFEGRMVPQKALAYASRLWDMGVEELSIGDTIGQAVPDEHPDERHEPVPHALLMRECIDERLSRLVSAGKLPAPPEEGDRLRSADRTEPGEIPPLVERLCGHGGPVDAQFYADTGHAASVVSGSDDLVGFVDAEQPWVLAKAMKAGDGAAVNQLAASPVAGVFLQQVSPRDWFHNTFHPNDRGHRLLAAEDRVLHDRTQFRREAVALVREGHHSTHLAIGPVGVTHTILRPCRRRVGR